MARSPDVVTSVGLAVVVVLLCGLAVGGAGGTPTPDAADPAVWIDIDVDDDGDADWTIEYRFELDDEAAEDAFEALADDVEAGGADVPLDADAMEAYLAESAAVNDRDMAIVDPDWTHTIEDGVGTLALELTWTGFAGTVGDHLEVGSAFYATGGTWFATLDADMRLTIEGPAEPESVPDGATIDDGVVTWDGPQTFAAGDIDLRYPAPTDAGWPTAAWLGLAVAALVLVVGGLGVAYRRGWRPRLGGDSAAPEEPVEELDESLLSDPERVERLLRDNGGRMKQAAIVEATGWSSAKVSQLLSEMAEAQRIEKLRIGQENLISLPDDDDVDP